MGHSHHAHVRVPPRVQRLLLLALAPFVVATLVGLVLLWPGDDPGAGILGGGVRAQEFTASVVEVEPQPCPDLPGRQNFECSRVTVELEEGADAGETFALDYSTGPQARAIQEGDHVIVGKSDRSGETAAPEETAPAPYFFMDFDRRTPLVGLAVLFSVVVIALSRWRGLAALGGLAVSLLVLIYFVLPAILEGRDPLVVAIVGGATIMFLALYLAHGVNAATTIAVLGTLTSLVLTGVLAVVFVNVSIFTGAGSEEAAFLQINAQQVNVQGLLLASIVIGTLGVLDDVTVTQASAVWELQRANPDYGVGNLFRAGIRIGRDHIASTVNTLVLAYAGASLPLLVLFSVSDRALGQIVNTEIVAEEIVRTLVGSIGLVASVPITTGLAARVVTSVARADDRRSRRIHGQADDVTAYVPPRAERAWWEDE